MKESNLKWWVLTTVIIGTFLGRLDQTIVNLALPKIINQFGITVSTAGWIATAYIIANAVLVPVWGKLGDTIGRKKVYLIGFSIFILGSALTGIAWNFGSMIVFRIVQAIAVSADYPTAMAIIVITFKEGRERAQALGIWSVAFAVASVFGPLIGGPLIDNFGWRSVFLINIPLGFIGIIMALKFISESASKKESSFDFLGAIVLGMALSALVFVLDQGLDWGWLSLNSMICYLAVLIFGFLFFRIEKGHKEPIVDFKFFKNSIFVGTLVNNFIVFMGMMGGMFLVPIFLQTFLGYDATHSGYMFMPMALFMVIFSQIGGRLVGKVKANYVIFASTFVAAIGLFLFGYFIDPRSTALDIIIPMSVMAAGMGFGMSQRTSLIASSVPASEIGVASSILALARNIAGAFGIAIFATILNNAVTTNALNFAQNSFIHSINPTVFAQFTQLIILEAQVSGYVTVFNVSAVIVLLGAIAALFMKVKNDSDTAKVNVVD